jgi:hypothetical protein
VVRILSPRFKAQLKGLHYNRASYRVVIQNDGHARFAPDIVFVHHRTSIFNLGDYLSSPRHYFKFALQPGSNPVAVIGGGVFGSYDKLIKNVADMRLDERTRVGWAVGLSQNVEDTGTDKIERLSRSFHYLTTRDHGFATASTPFCGCASVMGSIPDILVGTKTGILLNFDPHASGQNPLKMLDEFPEYVVGSNAISERDFRFLFAQTSHVVTNSYHTAFWSLLSGRSVGMVGFSSKYDNIKSMFDLPQQHERYAKGDGEGLKRGIQSILQHGNFMKLADPEAQKERLRGLNRDFANRLVSEGAFAAIRVVPDDENSISKRSREIFGQFVLDTYRV